MADICILYNPNYLVMSDIGLYLPVVSCLFSHVWYPSRRTPPNNPPLSIYTVRPQYLSNCPQSTHIMTIDIATYQNVHPHLVLLLKNRSTSVLELYFHQYLATLSLHTQTFTLRWYKYVLLIVAPHPTIAWLLTLIRTCSPLTLNAPDLASPLVLVYCFQTTYNVVTPST